MASYRTIAILTGVTLNGGPYDRIGQNLTSFLCLFVANPVTHYENLESKYSGLEVIGLGAHPTAI